MPDILENLNEAQFEAVTTTEGYVRVIAGAGSGKTRALSHRFAYLVNELGILPENILCATFTNKAANEMRQRIRYLTGDNDTGYICTFHSFCVSVLQEDSHAVQYPKNFMVFDSSDVNDVLKIIYEERDLSLRDMTYKNARDMIEIRKLKTEPEYYLDMVAMPLEILESKYREAIEVDDIIFYGYLYQEKKCFALDYDDLIVFTLYIFSQNEEIKLKWQQRLEYIMVDEFQDIDGIQYELMEVLSGYHRNLFIVGDPDQTIYTWRGADVNYLLKFDEHFPGTKTIMMMQNYRSTPEILNVANSLIDNNNWRMKKDLIPVLKSGEPVAYYHGQSQNEEAKWIAKQIRALYDQGIPYRDITILYRANFVTRTLEDVFLREKIPYRIYSGVEFFGRKEIKDTLAYLRMIVFKDDLSFARIVNVPKRNIGEKRMRVLKEYAEQNNCTLYQALHELLDEPLFAGTKAESFISLIEAYATNYEQRPISEVLSSLLNESGYEEMLRTEGSQERLDNLAELKQSVYEYETTCGEESTLEDYLAHIALFSNSDMADATDKVKLMTVHMAKGLEFPYVFICFLNEGVFPSKKTKSQKNMEEERRVAFVAITRAEKGLYLSEAEGKNHDGSFRYPSRFITDVDPKYIPYMQQLDEGLLTASRNFTEQHIKYMDGKEARAIFQIGQRVKHMNFGAGTITDIDEEKSAYVIKFDVLPTSRKLAFKAKLMAIEE